MFRICPGGVFTALSEGRLYRLIRQSDVPSNIEQRLADISFLGTDKIEECAPGLAVELLGDVPDCDFVLAAKVGKCAMVREKLASGEDIDLATSYPRWLGRLAAERRWSVTPSYFSGKVEGYMDQFSAIADLSVTGDSLRSNEGCEIEVLSSVQFGLVCSQEYGNGGAEQSK